MLQEKFVTYEVAKLAREKGFRERCIEHYYDDTRDLYRSSTPQCYNFGGNTSDAPTQSLLQRWLREEKGIVVEVIAQPTCSTSKKNCYWWSIKQNSDGFCYQYEECSYLLYSDEGYFDTYELALEDALKYVLENLI